MGQILGGFESVSDDTVKTKKVKKPREKATGEYLVAGTFRTHHGIQEIRVPTECIKPKYTKLGQYIVNQFGSVDKFIRKMDESCIISRDQFGGGCVELWFNPETQDIKIEISPLNTNEKTEQEFFDSMIDGYFAIVRTTYDSSVNSDMPEKFYSDTELFCEYQIRWNEISYYFAHRLEYYKKHKYVIDDFDDIFEDENFEVQYPRDSTIYNCPNNKTAEEK